MIAPAESASSAPRFGRPLRCARTMMVAGQRHRHRAYGPTGRAAYSHHRADPTITDGERGRSSRAAAGGRADGISDPRSTVKLRASCPLEHAALRRPLVSLRRGLPVFSTAIWPKADERIEHHLDQARRPAPRSTNATARRISIAPVAATRSRVRTQIEHFGHPHPAAVRVSNQRSAVGLAPSGCHSSSQYVRHVPASASPRRSHGASSANRSAAMRKSSALTTSEVSPRP